MIRLNRFDPEQGRENGDDNKWKGKNEIGKIEEK